MAETFEEAVNLDPTQSEMENMYLDFRVCDSVYAIKIRYVLQIIAMQEITELPEMPPAMKGFIKLRGSVIPVVSMRMRFGKMEEAYTDRTCIIIVRVGDNDIGLIVDAIQETITIEPENISPPPRAGENKSAPYITGIARLTDSRAALLMDVQLLFDEQYLF